MKQLLSAFCIGLLALTAVAQSDNPVLMRIAGKAVTRAEFEYAYNKNNNVEGAIEQKTVEEYLDMFINYKLKVAAAEAQRMDTLKSFQEEFRTYRDMQLPSLRNPAFIDSVARKVYNDYAQEIGGEDLLTMAHILLQVKQNATDAERQSVAQRADSLYQAIVAGADFSEVAKQYSQDPSSAKQGGQLPTIRRGLTFKEFEEAAYALQAGQMSRPFASPVGYHIVWVKERKPLDSYETLYPMLLESLKRQGIEEAAAEHKVKQLMGSTGHSREAVIDSLLQVDIAAQPNLQYLVQEYYDGLLLFEVAKKEVWDVAAQDIKGLERQFKKHKKRYAWKQPHFKGYIVSGKTQNAARQAQKLIAKGIPEGKEMSDFLKETVNKDSVLVAARGPYLVVQGESATIDRLSFGDQQKEVQHLRPGFTHTLVVGKILKKPQSYEDVKSNVLADHQQKLEKIWVEGLRKRFSVEVDKAVLHTVNKHK